MARWRWTGGGSPRLRGRPRGRTAGTSRAALRRSGRWTSAGWMSAGWTGGGSSPVRWTSGSSSPAGRMPGWSSPAGWMRGRWSPAGWMPGRWSPAGWMPGRWSPAGWMPGWSSPVRWTAGSRTSASPTPGSWRSERPTEGPRTGRRARGCRPWTRCGRWRASTARRPPSSPAPGRWTPRWGWRPVRVRGGRTPGCAATRRTLASAFRPWTWDARGALRRPWPVSSPPGATRLPASGRHPGPASMPGSWAPSSRAGRPGRPRGGRPARARRRSARKRVSRTPPAAIQRRFQISAWRRPASRAGSAATRPPASSRSS